MNQLANHTRLHRAFWPQSNGNYSFFKKRISIANWILSQKVYTKDFISRGNLWLLRSFAQPGTCQHPKQSRGVGWGGGNSVREQNPKPRCDSTDRKLSAFTAFPLWSLICSPNRPGAPLALCTCNYLRLRCFLLSPSLGSLLSLQFQKSVV